MREVRHTRQPLFHGERTRHGLFACASGAWGVVVGVLLLVVGGCVPSVPTAGPLEVERVLGEQGGFPGQFAYPRGIDFDGSFLWVVDKTARIQQIDPETGRAGYWWQMPESALGKPTGLTVAPATLPDGSLGRALYVADTHYHRVMVYALPETMPAAPREIEPTLLASFGSVGTGPGQFVYPTDVAVLLTDDGRAVERIYVSEYGGNDRISVFDAKYQFLFAFGKPGDGHDPSALEFSRPQSMVIDTRRQELLVADACNHRLGRFTLDGELLGWVGLPEEGAVLETTGGRVGIEVQETQGIQDPAHSGGRDEPGRVRLDFPYMLTLLADSTVLVTEFGSSHLQRIDPVEGTSLGVFGTVGRGEGELATPWGAVVDDRVTYILDSGNNRIVVSELPGVRADGAERGLP